MLTGHEQDRGATLVEAAIAFGLIFLTLFAVVEFGLAFKDWLSVGHSAREGARAGATFGQDPAADIKILREVEGVLAPIGMPDGTIVRVFDAAPGGLGGDYTYTPGHDCVSTVIPALPGCCDWTPCPEPGRSTYDDTIAPYWPTNDRNVSAPFTDRIGVEVQYVHRWVTGLFASTTDFTTATDFQLEPQTFGA